MVNNSFFSLFWGNVEIKYYYLFLPLSSFIKLYFFFFALLDRQQKPAMKRIMATPIGTTMAMITCDEIPPFPALEELFHQQF